MSVPKAEQQTDTQYQVTRRDFGKALLGGVLAASPAATAPRPNSLMPIPRGAKLGYQVTSWQAGVSGNKPTPEAMAYLKDIGVTWLCLYPSREDVQTAEGTAERFTKIREEWEAGGFRVYQMGVAVGPSGSIHNDAVVVLNLPGRDKKIKEYQNFLRYIGKAGIPYTEYAPMANGIIMRSGQTIVRGDAHTEELDMASPSLRDFQGGRAVDWNSPAPPPRTFGRTYSEEEIWENYTYFIKQVAPVAEEAGVRIGIHPDDPPIPTWGGVPKIFINFKNYVRALEIAASPNVGICLCCGNMLAAGKAWGKSPEETIQYFGKQRKIFNIHVQSISAPLPKFEEAFIDDCYYDYYNVVEALREVDYDGGLMPAHMPISPANPRVVEAYTYGYMRALFKRSYGYKSKGWA